MNSTAELSATTKNFREHCVATFAEMEDKVSFFPNPSIFSSIQIRRLVDRQLERGLLRDFGDERELGSVVQQQGRPRAPLLLERPPQRHAEGDGQERRRRRLRPRHHDLQRTDARHHRTVLGPGEVSRSVDRTELLTT